MAREKDTAEKKRPRVSIIERRLQNPFGEPSQHIAFKERGLIGHWFYSGFRTDQIYRVKKLGWEHVTKDMITDLEGIGAFTLGPGDIICRGERQQEFLMYMPKADYDAIQKAKTDENNRRLKNPNALRNEALEAFGELDPTGAERVAPIGQVTTKMERIEVRPELE